MADETPDITCRLRADGGLLGAEAALEIERLRQLVLWYRSVQAIQNGSMATGPARDEPANIVMNVPPSTPRE